MKGLDITAGSKPSFSRTIGSIPPIILATSVVTNIAILTTKATETVMAEFPRTSLSSSISFAKHTIESARPQSTAAELKKNGINSHRKQITIH